MVLQSATANTAGIWHTAQQIGSYELLYDVRKKKEGYGFLDVHISHLIYSCSFVSLIVNNMGYLHSDTDFYCLSFPLMDSLLVTVNFSICTGLSRLKDQGEVRQGDHRGPQACITMQSVSTMML